MHPHSLIAMNVGSSPLARGLPTAAPGGGLLPGIIPARAGFTLTLSLRSLVSADHPRSRGVYLTAYAAQLKQEGSSPLARGLL